jgi:hypothetical protein
VSLSLPRGFAAFFSIVVAALLIPNHASALADRRFDVVTFCCPCYPDDHLCQSQFDHLNWVSTNGHFLAMGSDAHRPEVNANGNFLSAYINDLNTGYGSVTGATRADQIRNQIVANYTSNGVTPSWVVLNEISAGLWPDTSAYRAWVIAVCNRLKNTYGHTVIVCSPFPNPGQNNADWTSLSNYAYIGVERYLSGQEVNANGNSVTWCQNLYQSSKDSYIARGVPSSKIYLVEHFGQTVSNTGWGRSGCSYGGWDNAINVRSTAAHNVGFAGFLSYAWAKNAMLTSDVDLLHFEDTYRAKTLP